MEKSVDPQSLSSDEMNSALFAQLVLQQTNMAMMLMGKMPHPETGQTVKDIEAAKYFIDQLEMLEVKTKGNLSGEETRLLKQSLTALRMAFVEAIEAESKSPVPATESKAPEPAGESAPQPSLVDRPTEDESHKKFVKRY